MYGDSWQSNGIPSTPPKGLTLYLLAFWTSTSGPVDAAMAWTQASAEQRKQIKQTYARAGVKIMVSAFGSTDYPILEGKDATQTANALAHFVKQYDLDGVDVDFEVRASPHSAQVTILTPPPPSLFRTPLRSSTAKRSLG